MRINQFVAKATGASRRQVDIYIEAGKVLVNGELAKLGEIVGDNDQIELDHRIIKIPRATTTLLVNKPVGVVSSREGQGSKTIFDLLPEKYRDLKVAGRLDKDSSGLLILSNDGDLIFNLTHPSRDKTKVYIVHIDRALDPNDKQQIVAGKISLDGRPSIFSIDSLDESQTRLKILLKEGRNRQIRRTFEAVGYKVIGLNRISIGSLKLDDLEGELYLELDKTPDL